MTCSEITKIAKITSRSHAVATTNQMAFSTEGESGSGSMLFTGIVRSNWTIPTNGVKPNLGSPSVENAIKHQ
jgi:hypothetical protein